MRVRAGEAKVENARDGNKGEKGKKTIFGYRYISKKHVVKVGSV